MNKILITLLLTSLVLTGCVGFGQKTNTNQNENTNQNTDLPSEQDGIDTSDWKTYRNEEYGFEFKYPQDWTIQDGWKLDNQTTFLGGVRIPKEGHFDTGVGVFELSYFKFTNCLDVFKTKTACIVDNHYDDGDVFFKKSITISHKTKALRFDGYYGKFDDSNLRDVYDVIFDTLVFN